MIGSSSDDQIALMCSAGPSMRNFAHATTHHAFQQFAGGVLPPEGIAFVGHLDDHYTLVHLVQPIDGQRPLLTVYDSAFARSEQYHHRLRQQLAWNAMPVFSNADQKDNARSARSRMISISLKPCRASSYSSASTNVIIT